MEKKGIVTLRRFSTAGEAAIYRSLLESAGIPVMITGEYMNEIYPLGETWSGIELRVSAEDEARALEILSAEFDKEEFKRESSKQEK